MESPPTVTVIIPTTAEERRKEGIKRAVTSIRNASLSPVSILLYVNGKRCSESVCEWLKSQDDIDYFYSEIGGFPRALYESRKLVKTAFFAFLDDDDELLSGSIDKRMSLFETDNHLDLVVGNGFRLTADAEHETQKDLTQCSSSLLGSLQRQNGNWLASCAGLYRTSSFLPDFFADNAPYAEWTYFAYKASCDKKIGFTNEKTYRIHFSENSLSSGLGYLIGQYDCIEKLLLLELPQKIKSNLHKKRIDTSHHIAVQALKEQNYTRAFKYHLRSLLSVSGLIKYFMFSRYFLLPNKF